MLGRSVLGFCVAMLLGSAALAGEVDLTVQVKTARPTTVSPVKYLIQAGGGSALGQSLPGEDGTTPVTLTLHVTTPSSGLLYTPFGPVFGQFSFSVAEDGTLSAPAGSPLSISGTTLTLNNDVDLPDFGVRMRKPTTLNAVGLTPFATGQHLVTTGFTPQLLSGSTADTALRWPLLGVMAGTRINVTSPLGGSLSAVVTASGGLILDESATALPASVDAADPQVLVIENTIDLPDFSVLLDEPTSLLDLSFLLRSGPSFFPGLDGVPGNPAIPGQRLVSKDVAHLQAARFPLLGLVPGQSIDLSSRLGTVSLRVEPDASLAHKSGSLPFRFEASVLVIENSIDIPGFRVRAANETNATTIGISIWSFFGDSSTGGQLVPGAAATMGVAVPILGVTPGLTFFAQTSFANTSIRVTAAGGLELIGPPVPGSCELIEEDGDPVLLLNNPHSARIRVYGESPVTEVHQGGTLVLAGVNSFWMDRIDPGTHNIGEKAIDGGDWTTGIEFHLEGMGLAQVISVNSYFGPNNAYGIGFRLNSDGTGTFLAPALQLTPWLGSRDIDVDKDGVNDNVYYVEIAPLNTAPTAALSTDNFTILSVAQASTVVSAAVADEDGDELTCSWYVDDVLVQGPDAPEDGTSALDLGGLAPLGVGTHTVRFEVSDGELAAMPSIVVTVENSPPAVVAGGGGVYEIGPLSGIALTGTAADFDGDELAWEWRLADGTVLASGVLTAVPGGAPVTLPAAAIGTQDLGIGVHTLTLAVEDELNAPVLATAMIEVKDTTGPTLAPTASHTLLWPPNHEMVDVTVTAHAVDASGGALVLAVSVGSDEPPEFDGSGNFLADHEVVAIDQATGEIRLRLRSERSGKGDGRTYTILVTATDAAGNASTATLEVKAPHDRRSK